MSGIAEAKAAARSAAFLRRKAAWAEGHDAAAQARLRDYLSAFAGRPLAGYVPIRSEIDPLPVMAAWTGPVGVPVIEAPGQPLAFRMWRPDVPMIEGPFGALVPTSGVLIRPEVLIVPLVAFDRTGCRLGYGGGYYDRTLAALRSVSEVWAVGFAYAAQEDTSLPSDSTDVRLDAMVTEREVILPGRSL